MVDESDAKDVVSDANNSAPLAPEQTKFPLFYSNPVPLSLERHGKKKLLPRTEVSFAASANAIPINLAEFAHISRHYPIAFVAGPNPFPAAIVGMRGGEFFLLTPMGFGAGDFMSQHTFAGSPLF